MARLIDADQTKLAINANYPSGHMAFVNWLIDRQPTIEPSEETARLRAELEAAQRRAECAERDLLAYIDRNINETSGQYACDLCKHGGNYDDWDGKVCPDGCDGVTRWEWRGPDKDEGGSGYKWKSGHIMRNP